MAAVLKWIEDPQAGNTQPATFNAPVHPDTALLDAYSATVVGVAEGVSPAVVKIDVHRRTAQGKETTAGSGSGFCSRPTD